MTTSGSGEPLGTEAPTTESNLIQLQTAADPEEPAAPSTDPFATQSAASMRETDAPIPTIDIDLFEVIVPSTDDSVTVR